MQNTQKSFLRRGMPKNRAARLIVGVLLIFGGALGFLPILGFWMIPLGLVVLSQDFPAVRRFQRRWTVRIGRFWNRWRPAGKGKR
ncbi:MAG: hypothetical protein OXR62_09820 [Ahrensia sp.]|nr:hypothetical protein [Ahrensia sp.]